ncbi:GNAT family N-acetyltransferase [uncultured Microbacterium sp.]|uniref:GNAT family N-acetyltransferase n=1 Tax=uncultured Microbacterium sp. TaxID=191216 RepID=UPI0035C9EE3D
MATLDARTLPLDPTTTQTLAGSGFEYREVDVRSAEFSPFTRAIARGFLGEDLTDEQVESSRERVGGRRLTGVYDPHAADPATPVATVDSWVTALSLPGRRTVPMWAISGVTVSPTRRRRGIARAMVEGELRAAAGGGVAVAGLTVSEATIYSRFGFAPAAFSTDWTIDTRRARWTGPMPGGRLDAVDRERLRAELEALHDRTRASHPGDIEGWTGLWRRIAGLAPGYDERKVRGVLHTDDAGVVRGALAYSITQNDDDNAAATLTVLHLVSDGGDAYRALWRFALEHDLVATVTAPLRSVDEPLRWMIADQRAARVTTREHHWLRVLDVPAAIAARTYSAPAALAVGVSDHLGFAHGVWRLELHDEGNGTAQPIDAVADLTMSVNELAAILLGGVRASTLHTAGRIEGSRDAVATLDRAFASPDTPYLRIWY